MTQYILAHDLGTSGDKATLFTTEGAFVATRTTGYPKFTLPNGGVEQDPEDWWQAFCTSTRALMQDVDPHDVVAVGFDGTFPNLLCLDAAGNPLCNAFIWQDTRAAAESAELQELAPKEWLETFTDKRVGQDKTAPKLLWLRRHEPELFERIAMVLPNSQDFIVWRLTGRAATDRWAGAGTRLMNAERTDWDDSLLRIVGLSRDQLPELCPRTEVVGGILPERAAECGLAAGTKVVLGSGDAYCADVGAGLLELGDAYITGGTSGGVYGIGLVNGSPRRTGGEASASGASMAWLKDVICLKEQDVAFEEGVSAFDVIGEEIAAAPIGSHGVMFHPHLAGERHPRFNSRAQGSFVGLSLTTTRADLMRAVVEGIGFNFALMLDALREKGVAATRIPIVGGLAQGAATRQIFADIMNVELEVPRYPAEVATQGTAIIAGMAVGLFKDERDGYEHFRDIVDVTKPIPEHVAAYAQLRPLFDEIYHALEPVYPTIYDNRRWLGEQFG